VSIALIDSGGERSVFPARPEGATGHYVADVRFPRAGAYSWVVQQGWFAEQSLGSITVEAAAGASPSPQQYRFPGVARYGVIVVMVAAAGTLVVHAMRRPRRRAVLT
jgi:hypothetical protein